MMDPRWPEDGATTTEFISHYNYHVNGVDYVVATQDVVHFRNGFDPRNIRRGLSDIQVLLREIATDNEAANWSATILRNMGIPGVIISPGNKDVDITEDDMQRIKGAYVNRFGGDRRGEPLVLSAETKVETLAFSPEQMNLVSLRRVPEERVSAVIGVPAVVAGLGAGLDRSTFTNMGDARRMAYRTGLIPLQRLFASAIQVQLVPQFGNPNVIRVAFDYSQVQELQPDYNELATRVASLVHRGVYTRNQALQELGKEPAEVDVLYVPRTVIAVDPNNVLEASPPKPVVQPGTAPPGQDGTAAPQDGTVPQDGSSSDGGDALAAALEALSLNRKEREANLAGRRGVPATNGRKTSRPPVATMLATPNLLPSGHPIERVVPPI